MKDPNLEVDMMLARRMIPSWTEDGVEEAMLRFELPINPLDRQDLTEEKKREEASNPQE